MALGQIPIRVRVGVPRWRVRGRWDRDGAGLSTGPGGDRVVQQADKHTGLPLWVVEVIDAQEGPPGSGTVKVKIAAQVQPVLPPPAPGVAVHRDPSSTA